MCWNSLRFLYTASRFIKPKLLQPILYSYNLGGVWIHFLNNKDRNVTLTTKLFAGILTKCICFEVIGISSTTAVCELVTRVSVRVVVIPWTESSAGTGFLWKTAWPIYSSCKEDNVLTFILNALVLELGTELILTVIYMLYLFLEACNFFS